MYHSMPSLSSLYHPVYTAPAGSLSGDLLLVVRCVLLYPSWLYSYQVVDMARAPPSAPRGGGGIRYDYSIQ